MSLVSLTYILCTVRSVFRKMQAKPIRNADFDRSTAKHVTFYNEKFKRGRCDLLKEIQRSTRGGGSANTLAEHQKEVEALKAHVTELEIALKNTKKQMEDRITKLELDMLGQMEQMMLAMQQTQQMNLQRGISAASGNLQVPAAASEGWGGNASSSFSPNAPMVSQESVGQAEQRPNVSAPTLPPHPKQKQLPPVQGGFPSSSPGGPPRFASLASLRGISLSRGLSRGLSVESTASAQLMRNSWEDKFFSMLMLGESEANAVAAANSALEAAATSAPTNSQQQQLSATGPLADTTMVEAALAEAAAEAGIGIGTPNNVHGSEKRGSLSSVSTSDMP